MQNIQVETKIKAYKALGIRRLTYLVVKSSRIVTKSEKKKFK
jgi:hypothetical protein